MRRQLLDTSLAQTLAWIWLGFLVAAAAGWMARRCWRKRRPITPPPRQRGYSRRLASRLNKRRRATKHKQRSSPRDSATRR
jgi:hypothetical protein